jgi:hypothetical protein
LKNKFFPGKKISGHYQKNKHTMSKFQLLLSAFLIFLSVSAFSGKNEDVDVIHYEIRLNVLDFTSRVIHGQTTITFTPTITI